MDFFFFGLDFLGFLNVFADVLFEPALLDSSKEESSEADFSEDSSEEDPSDPSEEDSSEEEHGQVEAPSKLGAAYGRKSMWSALHEDQCRDVWLDPQRNNRGNRQ